MNAVLMLASIIVSQSHSICKDTEQQTVRFVRNRDSPVSELIVFFFADHHITDGNWFHCLIAPPAPLPTVGWRMLQGLSSSHRGVVRKYHCTHVSSSRFAYHGKVYESRQSLRLPSSRRFIRRYSTWESSVMWYSLVKVQGVSRMRFPETFEMITLIIRASSSERVFWRRYRRLTSAEVSRFCDVSYHSARE